jgi:hypothetical protein
MRVWTPFCETLENTEYWGLGRPFTTSIRWARNCSTTHLTGSIALLSHPPRSTNHFAFPSECVSQLFHFPTQIAPTPTKIWLMNSRSRCTCDHPDLGLWHVNLGRERIRALQCPPDESEIKRGGFCYNWIHRIWLNSHERSQTETNTITFWDLLISQVHYWEQPFDPPQK